MIAIARLLFEPTMNIQAPPNLSPGALRPLVDAGINDLGGVSRSRPTMRIRRRPGRISSRSCDARPKRAGRNLSSGLRSILPSRRRAEHWFDPAAQAHARPGRCRRSAARPTVGSPVARAPPAGRRNAALIGAKPTAARRDRPGSSIRRCGAGALRKGRSSGCFEAAARNSPPSAQPADELRRGLRRRRQLRRQPQHQLHQRLLFPLPVLRLLEGQAQREPAWATHDLPLTNFAAALREARGSRRDRGLPCRAASIPLIRARPISISAGRCGLSDIHVHAFSPLEGSIRARRRSGSLRGFSGRAAGSGARDAARHGGGDPRRRGPRDHLPGQDRHRQLARR